VSPSFAPAIPKVGVVSVVTLSVCDPPLSEVVAKSGATGFDGAVASMVIGNAVEEVEVLPAGSVNVDEMFHVPSVSVGRVQFVAEPITYVHDTVVVPLVAEMVIVSPFAPPDALIVGVVSLVLLSESDAPESDDANKSRPLGVTGAVPSIVIGNAVEEVEVLPAGSVNVDEMFQVPSVSVGSVQFVAEPITYVHDTVVVPLVAEMVMVSPLVPPLALKVGVVSLVLLSESDAPESDDAERSTPDGADGGVVSMLIDNDPVAGPVFPAASVTEADTVHVPSDNVGSEQLVAAPTV
jgi:stage V sporulation protein SpoVS